jgi:hypothetical protein
MTWVKIQQSSDFNEETHIYLFMQFVTNAGL